MPGAGVSMISGPADNRFGPGARPTDAQECSFYWWRSRLGLSPKKRRPSKPAKAKPKPLAFAQVVVHPSTAEAKPIAAEPLRLRFADGHELILPASMPLEQVAKLVRAIESGGEAYRGTT
jgi:hypothetical protein